MLPEIKRVRLPDINFPTAWQAVIYRNFGLVPTAYIARVLGTSAAVIDREAARLGILDAEYDPRWKSEGYKTVIRWNWYLLDYEGIMTLLDVDEGELSRMLYDGGFVGSLGGIKPYCEKIKYSPLTEEEKFSTYELVKLTEDFAQSFPAFDFTNPKKCIDFNPKASFKCAYPTPVLSFLAEYSLQNTSEAQLRNVYSKDTDEVLSALKYFARSFSAYPKTDINSPSPKVFGPVSMWGLCPDEIKSSSVAPVYDDYEAWISPYTLDEYIGAMQKALFHFSTGLTVLRNIENPTPAADELLDIAFAAHVHLEADLYHTHYAYMKLELDEYARRLWSLARFQGRAIRGLINTQECDARLGYDPENHYLYTPNILKEKLINLEGLRKRLEVRLNEKTSSNM